ncbi:VCBS domain-containing protein, partial [Halodesulfovibrio marinisediminis]
MVAQVENNENIQVVKKPTAGEVREVSVGSELDISFDFDLDSVQAAADGEDLVLTFEDQAVLKLVGFANESEPVEVVLDDGTVLPADAIMEAIGEDGFIDTAAGGSASAPQGSGSSRISGFDSVLGGIENQEISHAYDDSISSDFSSLSSSADNAPENTPVVAGDDSSSVTALELADVLDGVAPPSISGNVLDNDTDSDGDKLTVKADTFNAQYGTFTLNPDGSWTYTLNNQNPTIVELDDGESRTDSVVYTVSDGLTEATATLTVTIKGTNDAPTVVADEGNVYAEEYHDVSADRVDVPTASGNVLDNDSDLDVEALTVADPGTYQGEYGTLVIAENGSWTYTLDHLNTDVQGLSKESVPLHDTFKYSASDGTASTESELVIDVHGTNDRPDVSVATVDTASGVEDHLGSEVITAKVVEHGFDADPDFVNNSQEVGTETTASGTLKFVDVDNADHGNGELGTVGKDLTYSVSVKEVGADDLGRDNVLTTADGKTTLSVEGKYGTLHYNTENGKWDYQLDNNDSDTQDLYNPVKNEDGTLSYPEKTGEDRFIITASDGHGVTEKEIVIDVEGSFDPVEYTLTYGSDSGASNRAGWHNAVGYTVTYEDGTTSSHIAWSDAHRSVNDEGGVAKFVITKPFVDVDFFVVPQGAKFLNTDSKISVGSDNVLKYFDPASGEWISSTVKAGSNHRGQVSNNKYYVEGGDLPGEGQYDFEDYVAGSSNAATNYHDVNFTVDAKTLVESEYTENGSIRFKITGTSKRDELHGTDYDDIITGNGGNDVISGNGGKNTLYGGDGHDTFMGGEGVDYFYGGDKDTDSSKSDLVSYENSKGVTVDLTGNTPNAGDAEGDTFSGIENLRGSAFNDVLIGDDEANRIEGAAGVDTLNGGKGNDVLDGGAGGDILKGGEGSDTVTYANSARPVTVNLKNTDVAEGGTGSGGDAQGDTLYSIENIVGSKGGDILTGSSKANNIRGGKGNDKIFGGAGDDRLDGGTDNDTIMGGAGEDTIIGGKGFDTVSYAGDNGGVGIEFEKSNGQLTIDGGYAEGDSVEGFEALIGTDHRDIIKLDNDWKDIDAGKGMDVVEVNDSDGIDGVHVDLGEGGIRLGTNAGAEIVKFVSNKTIKATADGGAGLDSLEVDKSGALSAVITAAGDGINAAVTAETDDTVINAKDFEQLKFNSASELNVTVQGGVKHLDLYTADTSAGNTSTEITTESNVGKLSVTTGDNADIIT